jgi:hypothetical protein
MASWSIGQKAVRSIATKVPRINAPAVFIAYARLAVLNRFNWMPGLPIPTAATKYCFLRNGGGDGGDHALAMISLCWI